MLLSSALSLDSDYGSDHLRQIRVLAIRGLLGGGVGDNSPLTFNNADYQKSEE